MFRAEVIGSMLRPSYLKDARAAFEQGELSAQDFKRLEDRAVDQVIAMQEGTGVDVVTDGEMRRFLFMGPITETVEGIEFDKHDSAMPWSTPEGDVEWFPPAAVTSSCATCPARPVDPVRLRLGRRRQPGERVGRGAQAAPRCRHGARRLAVAQRTATPTRCRRSRSGPGGRSARRARV